VAANRDAVRVSHLSVSVPAEILSPGEDEHAVGGNDGCRHSIGLCQPWLEGRPCGSGGSPEKILRDLEARRALISDFELGTSFR
jgi:hypothetical protein